MADVVNTPYTATGEVAVAYTDTATRLGFLRKVYTLLSGALILWAGTAYLTAVNETLLGWSLKLMTGIGGFLVFFAVAFVVLKVCAKAFPLNLLGLAIFAILMGFNSAALLFYLLAENPSDVTEMHAVIARSAPLLLQAFSLTAIVFSGISAYAITTKKDFSFLGGAVHMIFWTMFGIGLLSLFGVGGGLVTSWGWSAAWVLLMGGFVLYDTQVIMKRFPSHMAAMGAAMLLWDFVLMFQRILMLLSRRD